LKNPELETVANVCRLVANQSRNRHRNPTTIFDGTRVIRRKLRNRNAPTATVVVVPVKRLRLVLNLCRSPTGKAAVGQALGQGKLQGNLLPLNHSQFGGNLDRSEEH